MPLSRRLRHESAHCLSLLVCLAILVPLDTQAQILWDGEGDGSSWTDDLNWSTDAVPKPSDEVRINAAKVNVASGATIAKLTLSGATLEGGGTVTVTESLIWYDGTVRATLESHGTATLSGAGEKTIDGGSVEVYDEAGWSGGRIRIENNGTLQIKSSGTFNLQSNDELVTGEGTGIVINDGLLNKTAGNGTSHVTALVHSAGRLQSDYRTLEIQQAIITGTVGAGVEGTLRLGADGSPPTSVEVENVTVDGPGVVEFAGAVNATSPGLESAAGTAVLLTGTLSGEGPFTFLGPWSWEKGTVQGTVKAFGTAEFTGASDMRIDKGTVELHGLSYWQNGKIRIENDGTLHVTDEAVFSIQTNDGLSAGDGGGTVVNDGVLNKTAGNGTTRISAPVNSTGRLQSDFQTLEIQRGIISGAAGAGSQGVIRLGSGSPPTTSIETHGAYLDGTGIVELAAAFSIFDPSMESAGETTVVLTGSLSGDAPVIFRGPWHWESGTVAAFLEAHGANTFTNTREKRIDGATVELFGPSNWSDGSLRIQNGGLLHIKPAARLSLESDDSILAGTGASVLVNEGLLTKTDGPGRSSIGVPVENRAGGQVFAGAGTLSFSEALQNMSDAVVAGNGRVEIDPSGHTNLGIYAPGESPGSLIIANDWDAGSGILDIELGGIEPGTEHDQLIIEGTAHLGGTLRVSMFGGFSPTADDEFEIVITSDGLTGGFHTLEGLVDEANDLALWPENTGFDLVLKARSGIPALGTGLQVMPGEVERGAVETFTLVGDGFAPDVSVRLICMDCADPDSLGEVPARLDRVDEDSLGISVDLTPDLLYGEYDVVVENPRGGRASASLTIDGGSDPVAVEASEVLPESFVLHQNYPNPFNPTTSIRYDLSSVSTVSIVVFDALGRHVKTLVSSQVVKPGFHSVRWDTTNDSGSKVASGVYLVRIVAGSFSATRSMVVLR